jgi:hypothetical protein
MPRASQRAFTTDRARARAELAPPTTIALRRRFIERLSSRTAPPLPSAVNHREIG